MSYLPPERDKKGGASPTRIAIWVLVAGVGLWMVGSGLVGALSG